MDDITYIIKFANRCRLVKIFESLLLGKTFDFSYKLADDEPLGEVRIESQRISTQFANPIRFEFRGKGLRQREYLVFVVDTSPDDLLIGLPFWSDQVVNVDIDQDEKTVIVTSSGDWYQFRVH